MTTPTTAPASKFLLTYRLGKYGYGSYGLEEPTITAAIARLMDAANGSTDSRLVWVLDRVTPSPFGNADARHERLAEGQFAPFISGIDAARKLDLICLSYARSIRRVFSRYAGLDVLSLKAS